MLGRETVKNVLANVGITPGKFRVSVDGQEKVYYMADDGEIYTEKRALDRIDMYNKNTWLNNQSVGDKIMVFGREYPIGEDGHIHVPTEDFWIVQERQAILIVWKNIMKNYVKSFRK